ncbi:MAG TPA: ADP-ribosylglycohydrolase family protein [Dehalococcoidia bacterium]|nr:ADP-ribosylglycohydrolase family protein [Dehalococcoidia bacterium]
MSATAERDRFAGCLLGGAVGDALGAPIEFWSLATIRQRLGANGLTGYLRAYGRRGAITDDTQMTLFTAEGLLRADNRGREKGIVDPVAIVHRAYLRWLRTQDERPPATVAPDDGWLFALPELHSRRAPGNTCIGALSSGRVGTIAAPLNDSKGCGGVMRAAPAGLARADPDAAFALGRDLAAITHGHVDGALPAGFLAALVALLCRGSSLTDAVGRARALLLAEPRHTGTLAAVDAALALAESGREPGAELVETLGAGWTGEEALAIALYCALVARNFAHGVLLAVNHSGDSDSTGSIAGNILGATLGTADIPPAWLAELELRAAVEQVADDVWRHFGGAQVLRGQEREADWQRYP